MSTRSRTLFAVLAGIVLTKPSHAQVPVWRRVDANEAALVLTNSSMAKATAATLGDKERIEILTNAKDRQLEIRVNRTVVFSDKCGHDCPFGGTDRILVPFRGFTATGGKADVEIEFSGDGATPLVGHFVLKKRWEWTAMQAPILFSISNRIGQWRLGEDVTPALSPIGTRIYFHEKHPLGYLTVGTLLQAARGADADAGVTINVGSYLDFAGFLQLAHMPAQHGSRQRFLLGVRPELLKKVIPSAEGK